MNLISSNKIETNKYELEVAVKGDEFKDAVTKAFKKNSVKIQVPGFRKGKAPRNLVEKMYGKDVFWEDAVNEVYPKAYEDAVKAAGIEPVDRADVEVKGIDEDGFTFIARVIVKPEVTVGKYKGLKVDKTVYTVSDDEVSAEIGRLQERNSRLVPVEDRAAAKGDTTVIDFEGFIDDKAFEGGKGEKFTLVLGSDQFIPGFEDQVAGHKTGDEFDVNVAFPKEYHVDELKGKPAVFKVKLHEIKKTELPELDDEFAKDVSEFDTISELKADIKTKMQERKDKNSSDETENALVDQIVDGMTGEIPEVMFEKRIDEMVNDFEYRLQSQGLNLETYLQYTGSELASFRKTFEEQAKRQVMIRLALEKIAQTEKLSVSAEELDEELKKIAESYKLEVEQIKSFVPTEELEKDIVVNKAIDLVRESAVITEKAATEEKASAKPAAKKPAAKKTETATEAATEKKPAAKKPAAKADGEAKPAAKKPAAKKAAPKKED